LCFVAHVSCRAAQPDASSPTRSARGGGGGRVAADGGGGGVACAAAPTGTAPSQPPPRASRVGEERVVLCGSCRAPRRTAWRFLPYALCAWGRWRPRSGRRRGRRRCVCGCAHRHRRCAFGSRAEDYMTALCVRVGFVDGASRSSRLRRARVTSVSGPAIHMPYYPARRGRRCVNPVGVQLGGESG